MTTAAGNRNEVTIIGAGFGGICMGIKLRPAGIPFTILEKGNRVGGRQTRYFDPVRYQTDAAPVLEPDRHLVRN